MSIPDIIGAEWGSFSPFNSNVSQAAAVEAQRTLAPTPFVPRVQPTWLAPAVQDVHTNYVNKLYQQWLAFMRDPYNTNLDDVVYLIQNLRKINQNDRANQAQQMLDRVRAVRNQPLQPSNEAGPTIVYNPYGPYTYVRTWHLKYFLESPLGSNPLYYTDHYILNGTSVIRIWNLKGTEADIEFKDNYSPDPKQPARNTFQRVWLPVSSLRKSKVILI